MKLTLKTILLFLACLAVININIVASAEYESYTIADDNTVRDGSGSVLIGSARPQTYTTWQGEKEFVANYNPALDNGFYSIKNNKMWLTSTAYIQLNGGVAGYSYGYHFSEVKEIITASNKNQLSNFKVPFVTSGVTTTTDGKTIKVYDEITGRLLTESSRTWIEAESLQVPDYDEEGNQIGMKTVYGTATRQYMGISFSDNPSPIINLHIPQWWIENSTGVYTIDPPWVFNIDNSFSGFTWSGAVNPNDNTLEHQLFLGEPVSRWDRGVKDWNTTNTNDLTLVGDATWDNGGKLTLDGTGDYANSGSNSSLNYSDIFIRATWNTSDTKTFQHGIGHGTTGVSGWRVGVQSGAIGQLRISNGTTTALSSTTYSTGTESNFVGAFNQSNSQLYINKIGGTIGNSNGVINYTEAPPNTYIGFLQGGDAARYFNGTQQNIVVYAGIDPTTEQIEQFSDNYHRLNEVGNTGDIDAGNGYCGGIINITGTQPANTTVKIESRVNTSGTNTTLTEDYTMNTNFNVPYGSCYQNATYYITTNTYYAPKTPIITGINISSSPVYSFIGYNPNGNLYNEITSNGNIFYTGNTTSIITTNWTTSSTTGTATLTYNPNPVNESFNFTITNGNLSYINNTNLPYIKALNYSLTNATGFIYQNDTIDLNNSINFTQNLTVGTFGIIEQPYYVPYNISQDNGGHVYSGFLNYSWLNDNLEWIGVEQPADVWYEDYVFNVSTLPNVNNYNTYLLTIHGYYEGSPLHELHVYALHVDRGIYDEITSASYFIEDESSEQTYILPFNGSEYKDDNGTVTIRIQHFPDGTANNHYWHLDQMVLQLIETVPIPPTEHEQIITYLETIVAQNNAIQSTQADIQADIEEAKATGIAGGLLGSAIVLMWLKRRKRNQ